MNDESQDLLRQLEQATSSGSVDRSTLDDETAMLRENWLALGRLLQSTEEIPQVEMPQAETLLLRTSVNVPQQSRRWVLGSVAAAVAACLAWFVWSATFSRNSHEEIIRGPEQQAPDQQIPEHDGLMDVAWDDDWDQSIYQTALSLQQFHDEQRRRDSSLNQLQSEFVEFAREVESGSL